MASRRGRSAPNRSKGARSEEREAQVRALAASLERTDAPAVPGGWGAWNTPAQSAMGRRARGSVEMPCTLVTTWAMILSATRSLRLSSRATFMKKME